ncbi:MAG TPA: aminoglycoside adenylyltransferase domain-containing protein [Roseiflexaceae bacterium]|nr:aminoglycoside adenylyltransferase domain-containing protein [Roseiflexaceae bacterium]
MPQPTPPADVDAALADLLARLRAALGDRLRGVYLVGSLALGDFRPDSSDIDLLVVTDAALDDMEVERLRDLHARFDAGGSPWAARVEAVYVPELVLRSPAPQAERCPQVEKGTALFVAPLESGWVFQRFTLREHGVALDGPAPQTLLGPIDVQEMRPAVAAIAGEWRGQARNNLSWLEWLRQREDQVFVVQTLCRMLYSLATGAVASKPCAAQWAQRALPAPWPALIGRSLAAGDDAAPVTQSDLDDTVAFVEYTFEQSL